MAWWSFSPTSEGNFFLTLSKNTSYLKPGIVSAFFLGVLWKRTHPVSAGVAILAAPLLSVGVELLYDHWLGTFAPWRELFGTRLNFMHRVFVVFVCCVCIQVVMSLMLKRSTDQQQDANAASVKFNRTLYYLAVQLVLMLLVGLGSITAPQLSLAAAGISFLVL
ncbi:MAG: hypothetical protein ACKO03_07945, partial [Bacteroidota bacterium]